MHCVQYTWRSSTKVGSVYPPWVVWGWPGKVCPGRRAGTGGLGRASLAPRSCLAAADTGLGGDERLISIQDNLHTQGAPRGGAANTVKFGPALPGTAGPV